MTEKSGHTPPVRLRDRLANLVESSIRNPSIARYSLSLVSLLRGGNAENRSERKSTKGTLDYYASSLRDSLENLRICTNAPFIHEYVDSWLGLIDKRGKRDFSDSDFVFVSTTVGSIRRMYEEGLLTLATGESIDKVSELLNDVNQKLSVLLDEGEELPSF